jgi:hypothetical protein
MFKVKKGLSGKISTKGYLGDIQDAPQDVLKYLFSVGFEGVEKVAKKPKKEPKNENKEE